MNNNEDDWKKIQEWNEKRKEEEREKYGMNLDDLDSKKQHREIKIGMSIIRKIIAIQKVIVIVLIIGVFNFALYFFASKIKSKINANVEKTIEEMYNVDIEFSNSYLDDKENGKFIFKLADNNEIYFTAIKKNDSITEDYLDNCHKYFFDKWENVEKEKFIVNENKENNVLEYDTYIEINSFEDIDEAMNTINSFVEYCGGNFSSSWNLYLKKGKNIIHPYEKNETTKEEAIKNAKRSLKNINIRNFTMPALIIIFAGIVIIIIRYRRN